MVYLLIKRFEYRVVMDGNIGGKGLRVFFVLFFDVVLLKDSLFSLEMIRYDLIV